MSRRVTIALDFGDGERHLGEIAWIPDRRLAAVEWSGDFSARPLPLSPYHIKRIEGVALGPRAPFEGLHGVFADSLPDGWGRRLIDREIARRGGAISGLTPVDRLALVGASGMGALVYRPTDEGWPRNGPIDLDWFANLADALGEDTPADDLRKMREHAGGSAGARPKFVALLDPKRGLLRDFRHRAEDGFRHHIVKYRSSEDSPHAAEEELAYARMARAAGVTMTDATVLATRDGARFFAAERFDRDGDRRKHMHTAAGILHLDFRAPTIDYANLMKLVMFVTRQNDDLEQMARRMMFNALAHNRDDHVKNHAFLMGSDGAWRLSPAYDITFSQGPGGEHALAIAGEGRRPKREHLLAAAGEAGLRKQRAAEIFADVEAAVVDWRRHADDAGVPRDRAAAIADQITIACSVAIR